MIVSGSLEGPPQRAHTQPIDVAVARSRGQWTSRSDSVMASDCVARMPEAVAPERPHRITVWKPATTMQNDAPMGCQGSI